jgi:DNA-binding NarL/FixJ family response regulator
MGMQETRRRSTDASAGDDDGQNIGVVLCDDMPDLRELTRYGLEQDLRLRVLGEAGSASECFEVVRRLEPDALLLDLTLPDMDGLEAIPRLRQISPDLSIVVFSGMDARRMKGRALARGADAYVEKGTSLTEIRRAVFEAARNRGLAIGPSIPLELHAHVGPSSRRPTRVLPDEVAETLDEIEQFLHMLDHDALDARARDHLGGAHDAVATLRRLLSERLH